MKNRKQDRKEERKEQRKRTQGVGIGSLNPWTNKIKMRGEGMLNDIINKHLNDKQQEIEQPTITILSEQQKQLLVLAQKLKTKYKFVQTIDESMKRIFDLRKRCDKINQILEWIDKIQTRSPTKTTNKQQPIDSNFIYLPLHSGTTFHQILQQCVGKDKNRSIGEYRNTKLRQFMVRLAELHSTDFNQLIIGHVL